MKDLINIKNNYNKSFLWCHIRHINPLKTHPARITKADKKWLMILIMKILNFLFLERKKMILKQDCGFITHLGKGKNTKFD